jgi:glyoxylase-like metal-dependent hydrolase (beta-lactamase superfamily II)
MPHEPTFRIGSISCQVLSDGAVLHTPDSVFSTAPRAELDQALDGWIDEDGNLPLALNALLVQTEGKVVLVDAGLGDLGSDTGYPTGRLTDALADVGFSEGDVDVVIVSHCHPAQIGGLTREDQGSRVPAFPNARHVFWKAELDFWTSDDDLSQVPDSLSDPARLSLPPLRDADVLDTVEEEADVLPGVRIVPAPGHTPGHVAVALSSGGDSALYMGDAVIHELNFPYPDWTSAFDADADAVVRTRRRLIDRAIEDGSLIFAFHLAGPGRGERGAVNYVFRPL